MKLSLEVKTAILVILGIIFFIFGFSYLKGNNIFDSNNTYYTEFDYNSLAVSAPVTIKGNTVGKVKEIKYDFETGKTRVAFSVDKQLQFSKNSKISMYQTGLMGGNALAIKPADDNQMAKDGDLIQSDVEEGLVTSLTSDFSQLSTNLDGTLKTVDTLMGNLNGLIADKSENGLQNTLAELNATLKSYKGLAYSINSVVKKNDENITTMVDNFNQTSGNLNQMSQKLNQVDIAKTVEDLQATLASVNTMMANVKNGEGSLGKLLKDDGLYTNLEGAALQMEQLLEDMKLNPKRYVHFSLFGKKPKQYDAEGNELKD
ncbi:MAG: phospholipid/cholesterol/gamma-HCH transport system substrate-binding protein [Olleya marilimosa]|uniref:MCE family protein n=1 Tax=Olleya marilimosa TaxID=272164 RepID=A0ABR8LV26_9FLAO|nr:MlaD family protein [Olleya marilimosa]MBD3861882.1 MCE family protein [Olleya marilimosa]PIB31837.1 mammalian cell entry protein [Gaetbulibacter sp. 5U11]